MPPGTGGALLAERARQLALDTGFDLAGFARADSPPDLAFFESGWRAATPARWPTSAARSRSAAT